MSRSMTHAPIDEIVQRLADLLGISANVATVQQSPKCGQQAVDGMIDFEGLLFAVEYKAKGDAASIGQALRIVQACASAWKFPALPLVVVPYMGKVGQQLCEEAGVCWLDLSGNASLFGKPRLRIRIEGMPNQFKAPGRPQNLFAPKSARIARQLLIEPTRHFTQRELADLSGLDEGFTSRIVRGMEAQDLVQRHTEGTVSVRDPLLMLEAWREVYDFGKHRILRGHIASRSGMELLNQTATVLNEKGLSYAATGMAGAWLVNQFAGFRMVVLYLENHPNEALLSDLSFREESRGANIWLVQPNDLGVFQGRDEHEGIQCVHPVQLYMDLKNHPERAQEAADTLKDTLFPATKV